jgi:hypothetical protein
VRPTVHWERKITFWPEESATRKVRGVAA